MAPPLRQLGVHVAGWAGREEEVGGSFALLCCVAALLADDEEEEEGDMWATQR